MSDHDTLALLEQWNQAVALSMGKLHDYEQEEIKKFHGPDDLETDLRERLRLHARGNLKKILSQINPFFGVLQQLLLLCASIMPTRSMSLALVSGGAYLAAKKYSEFDEASRKIVKILDDFKKQLVLARSYHETVEPNLYRQSLAQMFLALIEFWVESLRVLRRTAPAGDQLAHRWYLLDEKVIIAVEKMGEAVKFLHEVQEASRTNWSENVVAAQAKVLESQAVDDESGATFPCHLMGARDSHFTGRAAFVEQIVEKLTDQTPASLRTVIISGGGGTGKSALALEAAHRLDEMRKFDSILWVNAEDENVLRDSFTKVALRLQLRDASPGSNKDRNVMSVKNWMYKTTKSWLLIYDNVNNFHLLNEYLPPGKGAMIVTTRFYATSFGLKISTDPTRIWLQKLVLEEARQLFNTVRKLRHPECDPNKEIDETTEVLESIDGLALGVKQMASYIGTKRMSVSTFLQQYRKMAQYILSRASPDDNHSLGTLWNVQFETIKGGKAAQLLGILAIAGPNQFPTDLLQLENSPGFAEGPEWAKFLDDPGDLEDALDTLVDNALIEIDDTRTQLSIHRLTQQAFLYNRFGLHEDQNLQRAFDALLFILETTFPKADSSEGIWRHWEKCSQLTPHVAALARNFQKFKRSAKIDGVRSDSPFLTLLNDSTWYLFEIGAIQECIELLQIAMDACHDKRSLEYAHFCNTYVNIAVEQNDMEVGRKYSEIAISIREAYASPTTLNHDLANSYNNFANTLNNEGKYDEALQYYERSKKLQSEGIYMAMANLNIARPLAFKGEFSKAVRLLEQAQTYFDEKSHRVFSIACEYTWASLLIRQGQLEDAVPKLQKAYDQGRELIPYHMTMSGIHYQRGLAELGMGHHKNAINEFKSSLNLAEFHKRHGEIARCARQLGKAMLQDSSASQASKDTALSELERAKTLKDSKWQSIQKFVTDHTPVSEEEEYNWLVAAWYR